jgi:glycosyltransferase involved in cell wall biosynthesis
MKKIGIYNPYLDTRGGGEKVYLALAAALAKKGNEVTLIAHNEVDLEGAARYFGVDATGLKTAIVKTAFITKVMRRLPVPGGIKNFFSDISTFKSIKSQKYDLFINNCYQSNLPNPAKKGVYMCMFPQKIGKESGMSAIKKLYWQILHLLYRLTFHPKASHGVYTYDLITANSRFTQGYIKDYWGVDSTILYPICENMLDKKIGQKRKIILNVGRFFEKTESNHHKRQDFLLENFVNLTDLHEDGWELHLAGSVDESIGGLKYILELIKNASGFPVTFHFNSSFQEMKHLYSEATMYWHATGYGSDPASFPEKQEHFGISTVEAMSAGAIPVVINTAGQKESVQQGINGYLWNDREELQTYARHIASLSDGESRKLRENAMDRAKTWDHVAFEDSVSDIFADVL